MLTWAWPDTLLSLSLTLVIAVVAHFIARRAIRIATNQAVRRARRNSEHRPGVLRRAVGLDNERQVQRTATVGSLLTNIAVVVIWTIAILTMLSVVGLPLGPLLASAGIGGVAIGFGAQSLVKDYISGLMMLAEDQYGVGDLIDTGEVIGTVEEVTLRVTRLRDVSGVIWYVRNGEIVRLGNQSQGWATASASLPVAPDEDPTRAIHVLQKALDDLPQDPKFSTVVLGKPTVAGVDSITATEMTLRVFCKTRPDQHWGVQREIRRRGQEAFTAAGIQGPRIPPLTGTGTE